MRFVCKLTMPADRWIEPGAARSVLRIVVALMLAVGTAIASAEPRKVRGHVVVEQQKVDLRGTEKAPLVITGEVVSKRDHSEAAADAQDQVIKAQVDRDMVRYTYWIAAGTIALGLIAAVQALLFFWQLSLMRRGEKQAAQVATAAADSAAAAKTSADAVMLAERAYVKLSHVAPGVRIKQDANHGEVQIEVKNHGRTPAAVTDVIIDAKLLDHGVPLPQPFPFRTEAREAFPNAFLVPQEAFYVAKIFPLRGDDLINATSGGQRLWVFGHVDYRDTFGRRHRGGYVRIYEAALDDGDKKNNLVYMIEGNYNFDRPRMSGEGNDWD